MGEIPRYAQTSLQLLNQLRLDGYATADVTLAARAHRFSLPLFSGRFRLSGKTFFAHLAGTASVLASERVDGSIVTAGLLHAVYTHGDFGDASRGMTDEKRSTVRAVVGDRVEEYIARYTALDWSPASIPRLSAALDALDQTTREVVLMRVANELDDYLDLGALYSGGDPGRVAEHTARMKDVLVQIAERLGRPRLAREVARVLDETLTGELPPGLVSTGGLDESFVVPAASHQRLVDAVAGRLSARRGGVK